MAETQSSFLEQLIAEYQPHWEHSASIEERNLLRLAVLRTLVRRLHAEKSRLLATGKKSDAVAFKDWEKQIDSLKSVAQLEGGLSEVLLNPKNLRKRSRILPSSLFTQIPKDKFERYDRNWESAIAAEAVTQGWCFWALEAWVEIAQAGPWDQTLGERLLPHGIVLFAENAESAPNHSQSLNMPDAWHGRWIIVLRPRFKTPDFKIAEIPGTLSQPSTPQWKLLFSPKKL